MKKNHTYLLSCTLALLFWILLIQTALANPKNKVKRFSVEIGVGSQLIAESSIQGKILYTPPIWENILTTYLAYLKSYSITPSMFPHSRHLVQLGVKAYFNKDTLFRPYWAIQGGLSFDTWTKSSSDTIELQIYPLFHLGVGSDFMITEQFGLTLLFSRSPVALSRAELNAKFDF